MDRLTKDKRMLEYGVMLPYSDIFCFSTTRYGGSGEGAYASFNCTPYTGDNPEHVAANRMLLQRLLPPSARLVIPYQTHGTHCLAVDRDFLNASEEERHARLQGVDALITNCPGCCVCVSTADCVPLLLYDTTHRAVAAVHAGWRGTVARIVTTVLERMASLYGTCGTDIVAVIGPSISMKAFETGDEVYRAFQEEGFPMERIACRMEKWHIDLWEANRLLLQEFGVPDKQTEVSGLCTYTCNEMFFSARRLGIQSGRMLSGIMIK